MIVEVVLADFRVVRLEASRVLARQDDGTAVAVAVEVAPGLVAASTAEQADFNAILDRLGLAADTVRPMRAAGPGGLILPAGA